MGNYVARLVRAGRAAIDNGSNDGDFAVMVTKEQFVGMLHDTPCYWVYASFTRRTNYVTQSFYALDIRENRYVRLPKYPMDNFTENVGSVLDYNLYVVGGTRGPYFCTYLHFFDPLLHTWSPSTVTNFTTVTSQEALAVSVDGRVYVFGGSTGDAGTWGEVYEPSTNRWTSIPKSETLSRALDSGLSPLRASAVLGNEIILRGSRTGIAFQMTSKSWTPVSHNLMRSWWDCTRPAVVRNMLITCHCDESIPEIFQLSIRAYDPEQDVWLMLDGIDNRFHDNAHRSKFIPVNGKLVIYHMWQKNDLRFSVIEINERLRTTVRASLLWQTRFPIARIINRGLGIDTECRLEYEQSLLEAIRADV